MVAGANVHDAKLLEATLDAIVVGDKKLANAGRRMEDDRREGMA